MPASRLLIPGVPGYLTWYALFYRQLYRARSLLPRVRCLRMSYCFYFLVMLLATSDAIFDEHLRLSLISRSCGSKSMVVK